MTSSNDSIREPDLKREIQKCIQAVGLLTLALYGTYALHDHILSFMRMVFESVSSTPFFLKTIETAGGLLSTAFSYGEWLIQPICFVVSLCAACILIKLWRADATTERTHASFYTLCISLMASIVYSVTYMACMDVAETDASRVFLYIICLVIQMVAFMFVVAEGISYDQRARSRA